MQESQKCKLSISPSVVVAHVVVFYLSVCPHVGKRIVRPYFFEFLAHVRGFFKLAPFQSSFSIQALPTVSFFFLL
jgi:hypothetical protein